ncbi:MAG: formamidopyrimidine-DNA glycosylase [Deltaproteobacteria bacterium]|nr:formamidopyrimidine-DNA glycosylase [Deltaproteobacteria bacterium]MBI3390051.1 formamidopyrimidine-DNA glycosylase [Deltaproteobacteria bacterium]
MPELPDVEMYCSALRPRIVGLPLERVRLASPFVLRSVDPPIKEVEGRLVGAVDRLGKRIVLTLGGDLFLVFHLMIAGRFRWGRRGAKPPGRIGLAAFDFPTGALLLTEASPKKRASLHLVRGRAELAAHDPGGLEVLECDAAAFRVALLDGNHTLKRVLTDPHRFSGIGNAYSDEILHAARLSPIKLTSQLSDDDIGRLFAATRGVLQRWTATLREQFKDRFPGAGDVTAFRDDFAVHGRYRQPCPACGATVQRIRYAENETNYCPGCQTEGRLLADRSLSRLLKSDWPRTIEEWEALRGRSRANNPA